MDDQQIGLRIRTARIRRNWRQVDLASKATVSQAKVSRAERGHLDGCSLGDLRRIGAALEIRVELVTKSRAADLDHLVSARHAALAEAILATLRTYAGWMARPEVSFAVYGERGVVDIVAWHAPSRTLLIIELKTEIVDVGETLGSFDRKRRLAERIAEALRLGWRPRNVGVWLVVAEGSTNRRRIRAHALTFRAALPDDGRRLRAWLHEPAGPLAALTFVSDPRPGTTRTGFAQPRRVAGGRSCGTRRPTGRPRARLVRE